MFEEIFATNGNTALSDLLNDAVANSYIADYTVCLRVALQEAEQFAKVGNDRMERIMRDNVTYYRQRIAFWQQLIGGR